MNTYPIRVRFARKLKNIIKPIVFYTFSSLESGDFVDLYALSKKKDRKRETKRSKREKYYKTMKNIENNIEKTRIYGDKERKTAETRPGRRKSCCKYDWMQYQTVYL